MLAGPPTSSRLSTAQAALLIAGNDLRLRVRNRTALLMGIVTPLVLAGLIGAAFGGGIRFEATIGLVDEDRSAVSSGIVEGLTEGIGDDDTPLRLQTEATEDSARDALREGDVDAVLVIPAGFGDAIPAMVGGGDAAGLTVVTDADQRIAGDVTRSIAEGVGARIDASVLAIAAALAASPSADPDEVARLVAAGQRVVVPTAVEQIAVTGEYRPAAYFGASMGILFLFFTIGSGARSLITERKEGTLPRVRAAPISDAAVMLGKSVGVLALGLASLVVIWLVTWLVFGASWGDPVAVVAILVSVVAAVAGISTMIAGLARTDAQADGLSAMVAFTFALLGGSFTQAGSLPGVFGQLTLLTPNGWALQSLNRIGAAHAGVVDVLPAIGVLWAIAAVATLIGARGVASKALR